MYGGDTTCIEVEDGDGNILIFDGGSGIRNCALNIVNSKWAEKHERVLHIFGSHEHLDHRSGLPFSCFCFVQPDVFQVKIFGHESFLSSLDERFGLFSRASAGIKYRDTPVNYQIMAAKFEGYELREMESDGTMSPHGPWGVLPIREPIAVGRTTVRAFEVYHGNTPCLGYVVERGGAKFVFCTDHELRHGSDREHPNQIRSEAAEARLRRELQRADMAYMDGQYFMAEYMGIKPIGHASAAPRVDWGHSCVEDVVARAQQCKVKRTFIGHHDPDREWPEQMKTDEELAKLCAGKEYKIELAKGSTVVDI
ncbi:MAG: MBL fold metallo-hydrolase [Planctomycetota bacterium]|nr:MBL fold metallo-hydrolase [Planctomycetota bacterium]